MEKATTILSGGTIVTMNAAFDVIPDGSLVIREHEIIAIGTGDEIAAQYQAETILDCRGKVIMPGLINAHTHVPMTLLRGMADDLRLDVWLMGYIMPVEREFVSQAFCRLGTTLACAEMIRGGTTTFSDMYYFESDIAAATAQAGLRALLCESILKFPVPDAGTYEESLDYSRRFIEQWRDHPLIIPSIAPHAPYSNTEETLRRCVELAQEYELPAMMIHLAETEREVEDSQELYNLTVIPWVKEQGVLDVPIIGAHCVWIDEHEMRMLAKHGASVAHCPSANLKLASGVAKVSEMMELGINVAIGTDGPASNNDLDMFEEMRLAALLAKVTPQNPVAVPARTALQMATMNGARALGIADKVGSLEVGKYADVIVLQADPVHNIPRFDFNPESIYSRIVYAAKSSDVQHTIVHGKFLMRDRQLMTIDEAALRDEAASYAGRIGTFLGQIEEDPLRKLVAVGHDVERAESFEIQMKARIRHPLIIETLFDHEDVEVLRSVHYRQFDTYFIFDESDGSRIRYREDDRIGSDGQVEHVRMRLTYTTSEKEQILKDAVVLSHSRFIAPASHPLRFYQEYFGAAQTRILHKDRMRWRVLYKGVLFFVNVDRLTNPAADVPFLELKTRTWSLKDAEHKASLIREMMAILGIELTETVDEDYLEFAL